MEEIDVRKRLFLKLIAEWLMRKTRALLKFFWNIFFDLPVFLLVLVFVFFLGINFTTNQDYQQSVILLFSVVVGSATLGLLAFQYASLRPDKKDKLIKVGEGFFGSTIFFIISVIFLVGARYLIENFPDLKLIKDFIEAIGFVALLSAAFNFADGLVSAKNILEIWIR
ncbi:MAG: hypothetical protein ABH986_04200 [archaeon]